MMADDVEAFNKLDKLSTLVDGSFPVKELNSDFITT